MLPPSLTAATITRTQRVPGARAAGHFDALLVITSDDATPFLRTLPEAGRWQSLHRRGKAVAGSSRSTTLANERQSAAVLGYSTDGASHFQRLALAGKMLQEVAARRPAAIAICVDPALAERACWFEALLAAALAQSFALPDFRSERAARWTLRRIVLCQAPTLDLPRIRATAGAANLARWLTALPPNHLNVSAYRRLLSQLARRHRLQLRWYSESALKRLGAGAFLAVARGNAARDAGIARLRYRGQRRRSATDATLVGKGILFDTGGTNLKPHRSMLDMHTDMAGSAVALGSIVALAELRATLNVEAWLALTENNIGPTSYRPQEVVRAVNGRTIQVIHSDAEGRMALADTLALAARAKPELLLDYATLTGACVYALTERYSGVFTPQASLLPALEAAGRASGERVWPFPLDEDFDSDIESRIADIRQCAIEGKGDHILATRFLTRFVPAAQPWVHVDLSAATRSGGLGHINTEITGFGVRFTLELLLSGRWRTALASRQRGATQA